MLWLGLCLDPYINFKDGELIGDYCGYGFQGDRIEYRLNDFRWNAYLITI